MFGRVLKNAAAPFQMLGYVLVGATWLAFAMVWPDDVGKQIMIPGVVFAGPSHN